MHGAGPNAYKTTERQADMNLFDKIMAFFTGGTGTVGTIVDAVKSYFPPSMSDKEKAELSLIISKAESDKAIEAAKMANEADKEFNALIRDMEGTAADLKTIPILGPILIFLRGAQRPVWGFACLVFDFMIFSGSATIQDGTPQGTILVVINVLVLGFLFSERAIKNVMPLIIQLFGAKAAPAGK